MMDKVCQRCSKEKPASEFYTDARTRDGLRTWCKSCWNEYQRARSRRPDVRAQRNKANAQWRQNNPDRQRAIYRRSRLKRSFGITVEEYDRRLADQGGQCAACGSADNGDSRFDTFAVDHDHQTAQIRGLLCSGCNKALGLVNDDVDRLMALAAYVLQNQNILIGASA